MTNDEHKKAWKQLEIDAAWAQSAAIVGNALKPRLSISEWISARMRTAVERAKKDDEDGNQ